MTERDRLIDMGKQAGLIPDQLYFLMALREVEGGSEGNEFNIKAVQDTCFEEQAQWAIDSIKKNEQRWQRYILEQSYMDYISFFAYLGGPMRSGWHINESPRVEWINNMKQAIERIKNGFEIYSELGEELGHEQDRGET